MRCLQYLRSFVSYLRAFAITNGLEVNVSSVGIILQFSKCFENVSIGLQY